VCQHHERDTHDIGGRRQRALDFLFAIVQYDDKRAVDQFNAPPTWSAR
jgi:hypothetical protein